jgi:hypothetical protein
MKILLVSSSTWRFNHSLEPTEVVRAMVIIMVIMMVMMVVTIIMVVMMMMVE